MLTIPKTSRKRKTERDELHSPRFKSRPKERCSDLRSSCLSILSSSSLRDVWVVHMLAKLSIFCLGSRTVDPRWCRGCHNWIAAANFTYGSNGLDNDCLYVFQCVWRICKGQHKLEWLAQVRANDIKLKAVLDHYRAHRSAVSTANKQKPMTIN